MRYSINMIRHQREIEKQYEKIRLRILALSVSCFGVLGLSLFYAILQIIPMVRALSGQKQEVARIELEYSKYKATQLVVDKQDLEHLIRLQQKGVVWTKKLSSLASHLPNNYWITSFGYDGEALSVKGYGLPADNQDQLLSLNKYMENLQSDSLFGDVFKKVYLKSTHRITGGSVNKVSFEISAESFNGGGGR
jgi:hypothetical protein